MRRRFPPGIWPAAATQERADGFRLGLADHGYVEGRNIIVEWRDSEGRLDRLPGLAAELVGLPVDVLVADGSSATRALKDATATIPIVMATSASPVEQGLVASLARPGGNVTGLTSISRELDQKRLELLKEAVPGLARVGVLWNPDMADRAGEFQEVEEAARALGLEVRSLEVRDHGALEAAFERASAERVDGLFVIDESRADDQRAPGRRARPAAPAADELGAARPRWRPAGCSPTARIAPPCTAARPATSTGS